MRTGLVPVEVSGWARPLCAPAWVRDHSGRARRAAHRAASRTASICSPATRIASGVVKVTMIEVRRTPSEFRAVGGRLAAGDTESFCVDPMVAALRIQLPPAGGHRARAARGADRAGKARLRAGRDRGGVGRAHGPRLAAALIAGAPLSSGRCRPGRVVQLPRGRVDLHSEMPVDGRHGGARRAPGHRAADGRRDFSGRAAIVVRGSGVRLRDFTIDGNREALEMRAGLPPSDVPFARFTRANGILAEDVARLHVENVGFRNIAGFAVLVSRSRDVAHRPRPA